MPKSKAPPRKSRRQPGVGDLLGHAFDQTTRRIRDMHASIAGTSFAAPTRVPIVAGPARLAAAVHDLIAGGVYATVGMAGRAALTAAGALGERLAPIAGGARLDALQAVVNGVYGDHLEATDSALAIRMGLFDEAGAVALTAAGVGRVAAGSGDRVVLFIHGLACDQRSWRRAAPGDTALPAYGMRLAAETGRTALYLRYNSGQAIEFNGRALARLLQKLTELWPRPLRELVLVGHSMGGLVARVALADAVRRELDWLAPTRMLICLGTPQRGAPLEKLGALATSTLAAFQTTRPLAEIANARSRGIRDLRHGLARTPTPHHGVALRLLGAELATDRRHLRDAWLGDGLVPISSATSALDESLDIETAALSGIGHLELLNHPKVYGWVRRWVGE